MEVGPPKQRPDSSRLIVQRSVIGQIIGRSLFVNVWKPWYRANRASWFWWVDPVDGLRKRCRIRGGSVKAKLVAPGGEVWNLSMVLETWE